MERVVCFSAAYSTDESSLPYMRKRLGKCRSIHQRHTADDGEHRLTLLIEWIQYVHADTTHHLDAFAHSIRVRIRLAHI